MDIIPTNVAERIDIDRNRYDTLSRRTSMANLRALNSIGNKIDILPDTIREYREILEEVTNSDVETVRNMCRTLHIILIDRTYYNRSFKSPLFSRELNNLRAMSFKIEQLKEIAEIYLYAIEESLIQ